ncbi:hypothetical protein AVV02_gp054 [Bacillus phage AvesoBmore]|uniref:Uncharacterized protein n=1 Tax=Bacillus phage AvesoBmore TaxID=1698451 RepID=A0A0K2D0P7_9CAUD|nr:hypothetical protein AVV02_gp054 [Bacillus phage AvesoBmore]ALA13298.1 hypothetical protein AVESOBMORE_54 [Bacillus phage AvesoBmore]
MYPPVEYNILLVKAIIVALFIYTLVVFFGFKKSVKEHREDTDYAASIKGALNALSEIKDNLRRDNKMTEVKVSTNKLSLTDLVSRKASITDYAEIIASLTKLAKNRFNDYQFTYYPAQDESREAHFMQIVSNWHDDPELHKEVFRKGIDYGANMKVLRDLFAEHVRAGHVVDLGADVMVITDDGTGNPPTGVSSINTGLEGSEIAFIIAFVKKENYKEWCENNFPDDQEEKKQGKTEDAKIQLVVNNA